ncbi:kinase-like domain-containing protein [Rhizophagus irregularis DAOM 181602=DAOM 197198]|nr:kinase-like domain-containing protein [Rhizophagus irregularis DAOM 181602=DAOM 197198]
MYSALWNNGSLHYDINKEELTRKPNIKVVLKCLNNFQNIIDKAITCYDSMHGISQNPDTKDYFIVLQDKYCEKCGEKYTNKRIKQYSQDIFDKLFNKDKNYNIGISQNPDTKEYIIVQVTLKCFNDSQNIIDELLNEAKSYNTCYGISQTPNTKEYIIILQNGISEDELSIWNDSPSYYNSIKEEMIRKSEKVTLITLNYLNKSQNTIDDFLNKVKGILMVNNCEVYDSFHKKYYSLMCGISQNPDTGNYIIVSQDEYCEKCTIWKNGPLYINKKWIRNSYTNVVLKSLDINEFPSKTNNNNDISGIYGISQNSDTKEYIIVLSIDKYCEKCAIWKNGPLYHEEDRKEWIRNSCKKVVLKCLTLDINKFFIEANNYNDIYGMSQNQNKKGYILVLQNNRYCKRCCKPYNDLENNFCIHISDMGLCGEVGNEDETKIYGVMPYVAPEVLRGKPYTQAADVYSFGMVMYYIITGKQPFENRAHDSLLALDICNGIRPEIPEIPEIPELKSNLYIDLMKKCWDSDPDKRPNVELIGTILSGLYDDIEIAEKYLFKEYKENKPLTSTHPQAIYSSRLLNPYTEGLSTYFTELNEEK